MTDTDNLSRRRFLQATGGAASAAALAGCTGGDESDSGTETETETETEESEQPDDDENVLRLTNSTMSTMDPVKATDTASGTVIQQVFDGLTNYPNGEVEPVGQLAEDYEVSEDNTTYTFHLKEGVEFHNGEEVTAQDFVYSWERLAGSENSNRYYFILDFVGIEHETTTETDDDGEEYEAYEPGTLAVEATDDYTLEITLSEPFHATIPMLAYTSFAVLPEGIIGDVDGYDGEMDHAEFATESPIGAGPFEFDEWASDTECSISRYDNYHGDVASVDGVHWNIVEDPNARWTYATNQNADVFGIPTEFYDPSLLDVEGTDDLGRRTGTYGPVDRAGGETFEYQGVATISAFYIGFNTDRVEKPVRQAAAYAMDQHQVIEQIFKGRGVASYHFTPPNIYPDGPEAYDQHAEESYPYGYGESQLDQARQVMEDAGYDEDNRASFTFTVYESSGTWEDLGILLRDQLTSAHIDMEVERAPFSTLLERGRSGNLDSYSLGWIMDWPAPDNFLQLLNPPQTDTSQDSPTAYTNWADTDAAQQAEEAWAQVESNSAPTDEAEQARNEAYVQIEEANWEDVTFLPTYHRIDERFNYSWVDIPKFGGGGPSRQMYNNVELGDRN